MHSLNIQLPDDAYVALAAVAESNGRSVEATAADQLTVDFTDELPASFWNPERLAEMREAVANIDAGHFLTSEQVEERLAANRAKWLQDHP